MKMLQIKESCSFGNTEKRPTINCLGETKADYKRQACVCIYVVLKNIHHNLNNRHLLNNMYHYLIFFLFDYPPTTRLLTS